MISIKSNAEEQMSSAVLVSFAANWKFEIENRCISAIIRKRIPTSMVPEWLYFHVNAPVGQICARAKITDIRKISLQEAREIQGLICLSNEIIENYFGNSEFIGCYFIDAIEIARNKCTISRLKNIMHYNPPQSFLYISKDGKKIVDDICDFQR